MRILITGGAGFVGSNLALAYRERYPDAEIVALDNLRRRGSELNLPILKSRNVVFQHGDIRSAADLFDLSGNFDLMVEASAEPSVLAGLDGSPAYVLQSNLVGTLNCLEFVRERVGALMFLSTSRVYSIAPLRAITLRETASRFVIDNEQLLAGLSADGIAEGFPVDTARSIYGATKLASELVIQEYAATYGVLAVINRCGVIAGPGQFGKVDQGVFTLWVANHYFGRPLQYTGFGGEGKQVRDLLHPRDLFELIEKQIASIDEISGQTFNVGGGTDVSTSMREMTEHCQTATGRKVEIASNPKTSPVDIPLYITDASRARERFDWKPTRGVATIVGEISSWLRDNEATLGPLFN
ncbi:MAG: NAD-dependent epimerase/dehydratase family protein [bacterium]|nr:NAD-dependent epimerase/dehydratase family protein [Candidatus Kapabacteria bacterium]